MTNLVAFTHNMQKIETTKTNIKTITIPNNRVDIDRGLLTNIQHLDHIKSI